MNRSGLEIAYLQLTPKFGEMVHHFPHEVYMSHEHAGVSFPEQHIQAFETGFEALSIFIFHHLGQSRHGLAR